MLTPEEGALRTATAMRFDVFIDIFFAVVIGKLLTCFNKADCIDENMTTLYLWVTIRAAGMIDIAGNVRARRAVNRLPGVHLKEVFAAARVRLGVRDRSTDVFNTCAPLF